MDDIKMRTTCLKEAQLKVKKWTNKNGFKWSVYADFCHLVEEVGELGEALTVKQGERKAGSGSKGLADHSDVNEEIGDILFSLMAIANRFKVNLDDCLGLTIDRYNKKLNDRQK